MSHLAELAFHFARSSDRERGIDYSQRAAVSTLHTYAAEEAISHYRLALELLLPDDQRRGNLLLGVGEAALQAGKEEEAETYFEAAHRWLSQGEIGRQLCEQFMAWDERCGGRRSEQRPIQH